MYTIALIIHIVVALSLIAVILIQRGRSGGLVEALGGIESIFGTKTSSFFVKLTVVLAILFFVTSVSLAYLSKEKGKSLMDKYKVSNTQPFTSQPQGSATAGTGDTTTTADTSGPTTNTQPAQEKQ